jgi:hypothetical protein
MERESDTMDWLPDETTTPLAAALSYRAHGFRPIPICAPSGRGCSCRMGRSCQAAGKHPVVRGWQRSQANERTIRARWSAWPRTNVGLATGGPGRLVVLDVDGDEGRQSLHALQESHEPLPETLTSACGRNLSTNWRLSLAKWDFEFACSCLLHQLIRKQSPVPVKFFRCGEPCGV